MSQGWTMENMKKATTNNQSLSKLKLNKNYTTKQNN